MVDVREIYGIDGDALWVGNLRLDSVDVKSGVEKRLWKIKQ